MDPTMTPEVAPEFEAATRIIRVYELHGFELSTLAQADGNVAFTLYESGRLHGGQSNADRPLDEVQSMMGDLSALLVVASGAMHDDVQFLTGWSD